MNQNISTRSWNPLVTSREGLLTNEVQNGVTIARNYDALARPTGYACRSADEEGETRSSPEPGDQGVRLSALVGTGAEDMRDNDFPIPARSPSVREAVSTASGFRRDSGFSLLTRQMVHPTNRAPRVVEYAYDHRGRMVWKTIGGTNGPPDKALAYVWDDYNIVRERKNDENTYNIWGLDLDGAMQGCGGVGGLLAVVKNGEVYTPTYDANGNISEYVDTSGTIIAHQEYDPFGNAVVSTGDAPAFTHWFSTKPWCGVTGMVEYQYRNYKPGIGRWMSRDPLEEHGARDYALVGHCHNNPIDLFEVLGKQFEWIGPLQDFRYQMIGDSFVPPPPAPAVEESQEESSELWQYVSALARGFAEGLSDAIHSAEYLKCEAACSLDVLIGSLPTFGLKINIGNELYTYDESIAVIGYSPIGTFSDATETYAEWTFNELGGSERLDRVNDLLSRKHSKLRARHRHRLKIEKTKLESAVKNVELTNRISNILTIISAIEGYWECYDKHCRKCLEIGNSIIVR